MKINGWALLGPITLINVIIMKLKLRVYLIKIIISANVPDYYDNAIFMEKFKISNYRYNRQYCGTSYELNTIYTNTDLSEKYNREKYENIVIGRKLN